MNTKLFIIATVIFILLYIISWIEYGLHHMSKKEAKVLVVILLVGYFLFLAYLTVNRIMSMGV